MNKEKEEKESFTSEEEKLKASEIRMVEEKNTLSKELEKYIGKFRKHQAKIEEITGSSAVRSCIDHFKHIKKNREGMNKYLKQFETTNDVAKTALELSKPEDTLLDSEIKIFEEIRQDLEIKEFGEFLTTIEK